MVFTSFHYLLVFLPIAVLIVALSSRYFCEGSKNWVLSSVITLSLIFYATWNVNYLLLLLVSIIFNYCLGRFINRSTHNLRRIALCFAIAINLMILGYYKYTNFVVDSINHLINTDIVIGKIVLPLAISFFTFQQIAWLMDQYRNEAPKCSFLSYASAVTFFPHLIAGPIVQYHDLIPQFQKQRAFIPNSNQVLFALLLIAFGVFKKIVVADSLAPYVSNYYDKVEILNFFQALTAVMGYGMQLYFDFSGYCDIAIGSALLLGISLPENFNQPYRSANIKEFWQRWHITLGSFFSRYLYFPLGGSRKGKVRTLFNLFVIMFLSGIWHGAGVGFIVWGALHGIAMVTHRLYSFSGLVLFPKKVSVLLTFIFITLAWIPFRAETWDKTTKIIDGLTSFDQLAGVSLFESLNDGTQLISFISRQLALPFSDACYFITLLFFFLMQLYFSFLVLK